MSFKELAVKFAELGAEDHKVLWVEEKTDINNNYYYEIYFEGLDSFYSVSELSACVIVPEKIEAVPSSYNAGFSLEVIRPYDMVDLTEDWEDYIIEKFSSGTLTTEEEKRILNKLILGAKTKLVDSLEEYKTTYIGSKDVENVLLENIIERLLKLDKVVISDLREKAISDLQYKKVVERINKEMYFVEKLLSDAMQERLSYYKKQKTESGKEFYVLPEYERAIVTKLKDLEESVEAERRLQVYLTDQAEEKKFGEKI